MIKTNIDNIKGRRVLIVGFGRSGQAAARVLLQLGASVSIQDSKDEKDLDAGLISFFRSRGARFYLNELPEDLSSVDMLLLSPGVDPGLPFIREARSLGAEVVGELEIAYRISKGNFVAVTGTNGKTTTTALTGEIFKASGRPTSVVGNIGVAVISESAKSDENDWLVTECSSFQLETTRYFRPKVSALLNLTPDHLNRHHSMEAYAAAKAKIFANQKGNDYFIANYEDEWCRKLAEDCKANVIWFSSRRTLSEGAFIRDGRLVFRTGDGREADFCARDELKIIGDHNVQNVLAAAAISYVSGIDPGVIGNAIRTFGGVPHRMEYCGEVGKVRYFNDSKGTNTDAAKTALKAIGHDVILIAGGDAKGQDFTEFSKELSGVVKELILLGKDGHLIGEAAEKAGFTSVRYCRDMDECVRTAFGLAEPGDSVLLSPACASWDMYTDFEQRGDHFRDCVRRLDR